MICAGCSSFFGVGLEDGHVPTFWLLLRGLLYRPQQLPTVWPQIPNRDIASNIPQKDLDVSFGIVYTCIYMYIYIYIYNV